MSTGGFTFSVFTKPWKTKPLPELGAFVRKLGFDAVEFPVREGYQVEPKDVTTGLPKAVKTLEHEGIQIASIAGPTDERTIAACAEAGVPIIRICPGMGDEAGYMAAEARLQREFDKIVPVLARYGVAIGVQNHCGRSVTSAMGIRHLIERYDPKQICAVLDAGHTALEGEEPELAIDIVWSHLGMVNLKNAFRRARNGPEAEWVQWDVYWTTGRHGFAPWHRYAAELKRRNWSGVVCLTAEYADEQAVDRLIAVDIEYAKSLFA